MRLSLSLNPVLVKEMRGRMRGPRAYLFLTGTLAVFGVVTYGLYRLLRFVALQGGMPTGAIIGQSLFSGLVFLATLVICAIAPSLTAGAISGEHERKTLDLLLATPLRASSVLFGKLAAALSYVALILLAVVPVVSLAFVFGGVTFTDMLKSLLLLLGFAVTYGTIGLFFSALFRRTGLAVGASYLVLALFVFGTVLAYAVVGVMRNSLPPGWILSLNPFSAMASALAAPVTSGSFSMSVFSVVAGVVGGMGFDETGWHARPIWQLTLGVYAWLTVALFLVTTQLVKPMRRFSPRSRTLAVAALLLLVAVAAALMIYGPLTPDKLVNWVRWMQSSPRNFIVNGQFAQPLDPQWETTSFVDRAGEPTGTVKVVSENEPVVRIQRAGNGPSMTGITQLVNQTVSCSGWLQLRVAMRIDSGSSDMCGQQGNECPLMLKMSFDTADGRRHEWAQGFHTGENYGYPTMCTTCENRPTHITVKQGEWYTYESPNLLATWPFQNVSSIHAVTLSAAGQSYAVDIREVAIVVREGRPLDWSNQSNPMPTPTPVFFGGGPGMVEEMVIPVQIAPAVPPAVAPIPEPTATGQGSPAPTSPPVPTPSPAK